MTTFLGFERENGKVGTRNHVLVIPLDDLSNAASVSVEKEIQGTRAIRILMADCSLARTSI